MSCTIVIGAGQPEIHNAVVRKLQEELSAISWLGMIYPIAEVGEREKKKFAQVYLNDGDVKHIDIFPKSAEKSYCFFELETGPEFMVDSEMNMRLNLIVWADMNQIDSVKKYDFTDLLIAEVKNVLMKGYFSNEIVKLGFETNKQKVFSRYDYSFEELKQIMFPLTAFKASFEMLVPDNIHCITFDVDNTAKTC